MELDGYKIKILDSSNFLLNYRLFKQIRINLAYDNNDIWLYLKFRKKIKYHIFTTLVGLVSYILGAFFIYSIILLISRLYNLYKFYIFYLINHIHKILLLFFLFSLPFLLVLFLIIKILYRILNINIDYIRLAPHIRKIRDTALECADIIKKKYFYEIYRKEKILKNKCPNCNSYIIDEMRNCDVCGENLDISINKNKFKIDLYNNFYNYLKTKKIIKLENIGEKFDEFKNLLLIIVKNYRFRVININNNTWNFIKKRFFKVKIEFKPNKNNLYIDIYVKLSKIFYIILVFLICISFIFTMFYMIFSNYLENLIFYNSFTLNNIESLIFVIIIISPLLSFIQMVQLIYFFYNPNPYIYIDRYLRYPLIRYLVQKSIYEAYIKLLLKYEVCY